MSVRNKVGILMVAAAAALATGCEHKEQGTSAKGDRSSAKPAPAKSLGQLFERRDPVAEVIRKRVTAARLSKRPSAISPELAALYIQRDYKPAWSRDRLEDFTEALQDLRFDGLHPDDYGASRWLALEEGLAEGDDEARAEFDLTVMAAYADALTDLHEGRIEPRLRPRGNAQRVKGAPATLPDVERPVDLQIAGAALDNGKFEKSFEKARPQHPVYEALRAELKRLLERAEKGGWAALPRSGLKAGMSDPGVKLLRQRLDAEGYDVGDLESEQYDDSLAAVVRQYQVDHQIEPDGNVGAVTRAALNVPVETRADQVRVNLERLRWQHPQLQGDYVMVHVPAYEVRYYRGGEPVWTSRVQVGKRQTPTPMLRSQITHVTLNPQWAVPPGMMQREILPKIQNNPSYLRHMRLRVMSGGREIDPDDVDWDEPYGISLQQESGPDGALGRAAIRFPSPYVVYLHETPYQKLFARDSRAFSNGCIRVQDQMELVRMLLGWDEATLQTELADEKTREVRLPQPLPIMLVYWTVDVNPEGRIAYKPDIYGLDAPTLRLLDRGTPSRGNSRRVTS